MTTVIEAASVRARNLYRSPGFRGSYVNGARAAADGLSKDACPFPTTAPGWRRTYRLAWLRGWASIAAPEDETE